MRNLLQSLQNSDKNLWNYDRRQYYPTHTQVISGTEYLIFSIYSTQPIIGGIKAYGPVFVSLNNFQMKYAIYRHD